MSSITDLEMGTVRAINAYCRVLEMHLRAIAEGATPQLVGPIGEAVKEAQEGLPREVKLLRFLREEQHMVDRERAYQEGP